MTIKQFTLLVIALFVVMTTSAQTSILGHWITVDDNTGEQKSVVSIYKAENGKYYGKIVEIFDLDPSSAICVECEGADYKQPIFCRGGLFCSLSWW